MSPRGSSHADEEIHEWVPAPGHLIAGRYRVEGLLGTGGMAAVVSAIQEDLGRRVAIKLMPPRAARSAQAVERFVREARAASAIDSDNVVKVFEVGRSEQGLPFLVMEFLVGWNLARIIEHRGALPFQEGLDYVMQAAVAIAHCHAIGLVHRDLKPENIMVLENPGQRGQVKVLDFGISKAEWFEAEHTPSLTGTSESFGTPTHMSPEQVRSSKSADSRTDIWALGVCLYEVTTGRPPFMAESLPALSAMIVSDEPVPPSQLRPDLPPELERIVLWCLAKKPEARPQTIQELTNSLAPFCGPGSRPHIERILAMSATRPSRAMIGSNPSNPMAAAAPMRDTVNAWGTTHRRRRSTRRGILLGVAAGCALFFVVGLGFVLAARFRTPHVEPDVEAVKTTAAAPSPSAVRAAVPDVAVTPVPIVTATPAPSSEPPDAGAPRVRHYRTRQPGPLEERR